jgi:hypothetical protein
VSPKVLTLDKVQELLGKRTRKAAYKWLLRHGIRNRSGERAWLVFESDVLAVLLRPGETLPVDHVKQGEDAFDERFGGDREWSTRQH